MALDTRNKRAASMSYPWFIKYTTPDNATSAEDRRQDLGGFRIVSIDAPVVPDELYFLAAGYTVGLEAEYYTTIQASQSSNIEAGHSVDALAARSNKIVP